MIYKGQQVYTAKCRDGRKEGCDILFLSPHSFVCVVGMHCAGDSWLVMILNVIHIDIQDRGRNDILVMPG